MRSTFLKCPNYNQGLSKIAIFLLHERTFREKYRHANFHDEIFCMTCTNAPNKQFKSISRFTQHLRYNPRSDKHRWRNSFWHLIAISSRARLSFCLLFWYTGCDRGLEDQKCMKEAIKKTTGAIFFGSFREIIHDAIQRDNQHNGCFCKRLLRDLG